MADDHDPLYVMSPKEIAWCHLLGHTVPMPSPFPAMRDPRAALERVVRQALQRPPCGVAFSGGRDSSTVLAVAAHVARREGLPEPIPITKDFPEVPSTEESDWQETVIRHLRLSEWQRVPIRDELDLVGPLATANLVEHGVIWPPMIHGDVPVVDLVRGGSLIDGEGGDEVLGTSVHRIAPVTDLLRKPRPMSWRRLRRAVRAVAPGRLRARHVRRLWMDEPMSWLRPAVRAELATAIGETERVAPLSFAASVRLVPRRRTQVLGAHNRRILARSRRVEVSSPLLHPDVVAALAHQGGMLGLGDRTAALLVLVSDLLPRSVLARTSKASFGGAFWGRHARSFAERWNGEGVDRDLVDVEELHRLWLCERHHPHTAALLQQAWLATSGSSPARDSDPLSPTRGIAFVRKS